MKPFLSIVIPTRDRLNFLRHALWSALNQSDGDLEVIVCDNPLHSPARDTFDDLADSRCRYLPAPEPLNMAENWNRGVEAANGKYVTLLEDKFALHLGCIAFLKDIEASMPSEIYNWSADNFWPDDESQTCNSGLFGKCYPNELDPIYFDPRDVVQKRLSFDFARGTEGRMYHAGKFVFGVYRDSLIAKMKQKMGRVTGPMVPAPDYTSMTAALLLAETAVELGRSLSVQIISKTSTGANFQSSVAYSNQYFASFGDLKKVLGLLPIPNIPMPGSNVVAWAYRDVCTELLTETDDWNLNYTSLYFHCEKELELVDWESESQKAEYHELLRRGREAFPLRHRLRVSLKLLLRRMPRSLAPAFAAILNFLNRLLFSPSEFDLDPFLWKRWTAPIDCQIIRLPNCGINEFLMLIYLLKRNPNGFDPKIYRYLSVDQSCMNSNDLESAPIELPEIELRNLAGGLTALCKEQAEKIIKNEDRSRDVINQLESKLENFRGMIQRRDASLAKLKKKAGKPE